MTKGRNGENDVFTHGWEEPQSAEGTLFPKYTYLGRSNAPDRGTAVAQYRTALLA